MVRVHYHPPTKISLDFVVKSRYICFLTETQMLTDYTPIEMLKLGVFGGNYFLEDSSVADYCDDLLLLITTNRNKYSINRNQHKTRAGQSFDQWYANGWIFEEDPLGWFQWYCRYYSGRRHARDDHQIKRYNSYRGRWLSRAKNDIIRTGNTSPVIKQGLLQWAIDWQS